MQLAWKVVGKERGGRGIGENRKEKREGGRGGQKERREGGRDKSA